MAVTAAIALSSSTATPNRVVTATCTVSNGGASDLTVQWVAPSLAVHGATSQAVSGACGLPPLGPGNTLSVAAGGTLDLKWGVVAYEPQPAGGLGNPASLAYDVGAVVKTSDGSVVNATTATLTVAP